MDAGAKVVDPALVELPFLIQNNLGKPFNRAGADSEIKQGEKDRYSE